MDTSLFHYHLPASQIAQTPPEKRDGGRLMVLNRQEKSIAHSQIERISNFLKSALVVINDSRVFPARLLLSKSTGGKVELLLLRPLDTGHWFSMCKSSKPLKEGTELFHDGRQSPVATITQASANGRCHVELHVDGNELEELGRIPLPPYIEREVTTDDLSRYQTIFANEKGSVAAPTAGLHFTEALKASLMAEGCEICPVTLHVGPGTFVPVRAEKIKDHSMEEEFYHIPQNTADAITRAKTEGRPVIAIGTTVVRTLEASGGKAGSGSTSIFIYPGYKFKVVDGLLTNFHLPCSTLLMLVSAIADREFVMSAYDEAVASGYRFYSYGDAMLIQ